MKYLLSVIIVIASSTMVYAQLKADDIVGTWYSALKGGSVRIYKHEGKYFGKLIDLKNAIDKEGKPVLDVHNPDTAKRERPLVGIILLSDITYNGRKKNWKGKLYDYDGGKGNTYNSYITITKSGDLNIKGFWGLSFFGLNPGLTLKRISTK